MGSSTQVQRLGFGLRYGKARLEAWLRYGKAGPEGRPRGLRARRLGNNHTLLFIDYTSQLTYRSVSVSLLFSTLVVQLESIVIIIRAAWFCSF